MLLHLSHTNICHSIYLMLNVGLALVAHNLVEAELTGIRSFARRVCLNSH